MLLVVCTTCYLNTEETRAAAHRRSYVPPALAVHQYTYSIITVRHRLQSTARV